MPLSAISMEKDQIALVAGDSSKLGVTLVPANAKTVITWTSSNEKVATVKNGVVKTFARGTSVITATSDNNLTTSCNITVTKTDLPYTLVWADEFNDASLDLTKWNVETGGGGWGNQEKQYYTNSSNNLRLENGSLVIEAKKETMGSNSYTSGRINTKGRAAFTYGRVEARISMPAGTGTWPAFWMLGSNIDIAKWPLCGEIDIVEHIGSSPTMVSNALHTSEANGSLGNNWYKKSYYDNLESNYHTYSIEWEEKASQGDDCINFYFDGILLATKYESHVSTVRSWPFNKDFFIIFNLAIGGTMGGTVNDAIFNSPVVMKVDYVRVYQRK